MFAIALNHPLLKELSDAEINSYQHPLALLYIHHIIKPCLLNTTLTQYSMLRVFALIDGKNINDHIVYSYRYN